MIRGDRAVGGFLAIGCRGSGAGRASLGARCGGALLLTSGGCGWEGRLADEGGGTGRASLGACGGGALLLTSGGCA